MDPLQGVSDVQSPMPEALGNTSRAAWRDALAGASSQQMAMSAAPAVPKADPWGEVGGLVGGAVGIVVGGGAGCVGGGAGGTAVAPGVGTVIVGVAGCEGGAQVGGAVGAGVGYGIGAGLHGVVHWMENAGPSSGSSEPPVPGATPGRKTKGPTTQWEKPGGIAEADRDFDAMHPKNVKPLPGGGRVGDLPDGRKIIVRPHSTDGRPTLEIQDGRKRDKVRYDS